MEPIRCAPFTFRARVIDCRAARSNRLRPPCRRTGSTFGPARHYRGCPFCRARRAPALLTCPVARAGRSVNVISVCSPSTGPVRLSSFTPHRRANNGDSSALQMTATCDVRFMHRCTCPRRTSIVGSPARRAGSMYRPLTNARVAEKEAVPMNRIDRVERSDGTDDSRHRRSAEASTSVAATSYTQSRRVRPVG